MRTNERAWVALLVLAGCGAPSSAVPVHTAAVTFDPRSSKYQLSQVDLTTITDLETLTGSVAKLQGGAEVVLDDNDPLLQQANTTDEIRKAIVKDEGGPVRAGFVTSGNVQWPADFHSENMVTTYYNFERSFGFFNTLGWTQAQGGTPTVFYFPSFVETQLSKDPLKDNAAFFSIVGGFMILPFDQLQDVPLPMNLGIIGHEYTHFMINTRVYDKQAIPNFYVQYGAFAAGQPTPAANVLKSFDEGFADLLGTGVTCGAQFDHCDPDFLAASIPGEADVRNLSGVHCLTADLNAHLQNDPLDQFLAGSHEYEVGTVLASSIWKATDLAGGTPTNRREAFQAVYDSLDDSDPARSGLKQTLTRLNGNIVQMRADSVVANLVVAHVKDDTLKAAMCSAFKDRLGTAETYGTIESGTTTMTGAQYCQQRCAELGGPYATPEPVTPVNLGNDASVLASCLCACQGVGDTFHAGDCQH